MERKHAEETYYLVKGKVKVYPNGSSEYVELGANDLVVLLNSSSCTWDVSIAVDKHYSRKYEPHPTFCFLFWFDSREYNSIFV